MARKTFRVTKRVTVEYTWIVSSEHLLTQAAAKRFALDMGEVHADEVSQTRESVRVEVIA